MRRATFRVSDLRPAVWSSFTDVYVTLKVVVCETP